MYKVTNITLHNLCQYDHVSLQVDVGLMAVCGRNGSGKSTLLRGLVYALTGLVDASWGTQANLQKDGTVVPGYAEVTLADRDHVLFVRRYTATSTKFPDIVETVGEDGSRTAVARRRREVDAYLEHVYGISCQLLFRICWGRQGQMDMLLTAPSAFVSTFLSMVFDTHHLEHIREAIKSQVDTVATLSGSCVQELEACKEELELYNDANLGMAEENLELLELDSKRQAQEYAKLLEASKNRMSPEEWNSEHSRLTAEMEKLSPYMEEPVAMAAPDRSVEQCQQEMARLSGIVDSASARMYTVRSAISSKRQLLDTTLPARNKELEDALERAKKAAHADTSTCPVCGNAIAEPETALRAHLQAAVGFDTMEAFTDAYLAEKRVVWQQGEEAKKELTALTAELKQLEEQLAQAKADQEKCRKDVDRHFAYSRYLDMRTRHESALKDMQSIKEQLEQLSHRAALTDDEAKQLAEQKEKAENAEQAFAVARDAMVQAKVRLDMLYKQKHTLEGHVAQYEVNTEARKVLNCLRDALSRNRVQARYMRSRIDTLNDRIHTLLNRTDMPFTLRLNPDTRTFEYTTTGGYTHPAAHLSGAQRNISAVILQMAILATVYPNINLFLVDEPAESLDAENKKTMAELFQHMSRMLPTIEGVMLIVTRDDQLIESCGSVFNVNEVNK